jgi:hypothetical protein
MARICFHNASPKDFNATKETRSEELRARGKDPDRFPELAGGDVVLDSPRSTRDADRVLREVLASLLTRDVDALRDQLCIGPAEKCAELLSRYISSRK